jgi:hypothetical protein
LGDVDAQAVSALAADVQRATGLVLEDGRVLRRGRSATLRYRVVGGAADHEYVIVKRASDRGAATFRSEAAAMRVLPGCSTAAARVPRLLYDLSPRGLLVIEDASPAESLHVLLERGGEAERHGALLRVGHALGQLHGAARSARASLDDRIDGATALERQAASLRKAVPEVQAFLQAARVAAEPGLCDALERLAASIAADGPVATITVGDMAPTNVLLDAERVTFIDLEYSGVRHPFYDAAFWRCIYPLTPRTADAMEARYRVGLGELGLSLDEATFARDVTRLCSHRLFWMLSWNMRALFEQDRPIVPGGPGLRSVLLHHLAELLRLAHRASYDAVLERTLERCNDALLQRWDARPEDAAPGDTAVFHIVEASVWQAAAPSTVRLHSMPRASCTCRPARSYWTPRHASTPAAATCSSSSVTSARSGPPCATSPPRAAPARPRAACSHTCTRRCHATQSGASAPSCRAPTERSSGGVPEGRLRPTPPHQVKSGPSEASCERHYLLRCSRSS